MAKEISVLMVEPHKHPTLTTLESKLEPLQEAVGGLIEIVDIDEDACILCNEEGKLIGLEGNRRFCNDIIAGTFYVCGTDEYGDLDSLSLEQIETYSKIFWEPEDFTKEQVEDSIRIEFYPFDHEGGATK